MACTQVKCSWLLPSYVNEVLYAKIKDIDFTSAKELRENLDCKIDSLDQNQVTCHGTQPSKGQTAIPQLASTEEMDQFYAALNRRETQAVVLSLIDPYDEQFVAKTQNVPVLSDLYEPSNLDLEYPQLLQKCRIVKIKMSDEEIKLLNRRREIKLRALNS